MDDVRLHSNSEIILVGGLSDNYEKCEASLREACWDLHSYIYNVPGRDKITILPTLKVIVNKSTLLKTSADNVRDLQQILYEMDCSKPGIKIVLFGHSKGAEVIYEALKDNALANFLERKGVFEADVITRIRSIRTRIAVFTMGGIQKIPKRFAKISCNFTFVNDRFAQMGEMLTEFHNEIVIEFNIDREKNTTHVERNCNSGFCSSQSSNASSAYSIFSRNSHYLEEYLASKVMKDEILQMLNAKQDTTCRPIQQMIFIICICICYILYIIISNFTRPDFIYTL